MSRDETHGGGAWSFKKCVWAPTRNQKGGRWPFWEKILSVRIGDTVLHLRGIGENAEFVGYSRATSDGFETDLRPPEPGEWGYSQSFYRANLDDFAEFHKPIRLTSIFS